jgi:hypothetical protein
LFAAPAVDVYVVLEAELADQLLYALALWSVTEYVETEQRVGLTYHRESAHERWNPFLSYMPAGIDDRGLDPFSSRRTYGAVVDSGQQRRRATKTLCVQTLDMHR